VSSSGSGTNSTTIPSAIAVAMFAAIGTWAFAKYAFGRAREDNQ
jgi:multisubunit Na+/H+ antiporter MnhF subunit